LGDQGPLVLFIDDAQWLDETSAAALDYIRRKWVSGGFTLVLCDRPESRLPGSAADRFLGSLSLQGPQQEVIRLDPLVDGEARRLIDEIGGEGIPPDLLEKVMELGASNPFYIVELTQAIRAAPIPRGGLPRSIEIPGSIRQVLRPRIEGLSPDAKRILMLLAVRNAPMEPRVAGMLLSMKRERCLDALEELAERRILDWDRDRAFIRHALIREIVYSTISPGRLAWLHGRVGKFIVDHDPDPPADQLALHFHRGGLTELAFEYCMKAADESEDSGALRDAIKYLHMALEVCGGEADAIRVMQGLATLSHQAGVYAQALSVIDDLVPLLEGSGNVGDALCFLVLRCDSLSLLPSGDAEVALEGLLGIRDRAKAVEAWEAFMLSWDTELHILHRTGNIPGAKTLLKQVETLAIPEDPLVESIRESILSIKLFYGEASEALAHAERAYSLAHSAEQERQLLRALSRLLMVQAARGRLGTGSGTSLLTEADSRASGRGDLDLRAFLRVNRGVWFLDSGDYERAIAEFRKLEPLLHQTDAALLHVLLQYNLGEALLWIHEYEDSKNAFDLAGLHLSDRVAPHFHVSVEAGIGLTNLLMGQISDARERFERVSSFEPRKHFNSSMVALFEARYHMLYNRISDAIEVLRQTSSNLAGRFDTSWIRVRQELALVNADRDPTSALKELQALRVMALKEGMEARAEEIMRSIERLSRRGT
jgi:tetratricopeptide (TPR) repeat protein